jgi:hypothetical protein
MLLSEKEQEEIFKMTSTFKVPVGDELEQYFQTNYDEFYDEMDFKDSEEEGEGEYVFYSCVRSTRVKSSSELN